VNRALAAGVLAALSSLSVACDSWDDMRSIRRETREAEEELLTVYGFSPTLKLDVQRGRDGTSVESVDVTVHLLRPPDGLSQEQIQTDANIVVRKHIRKVRSVKVAF
jgi:hypothetical protein